MTIISGISLNNALGFSFDGVHSSTYDIYLAKSPFNLLPDLINYFETIPGKPGLLDYGSDYKQRDIVLDCMVLAKNEQDLKRKSREIAAWLDPAKGLKRLILDTEPNKFYLARVTKGILVEQIAKQGRFEVTMTAPDPYAYALDDEIYTYTKTGSYNFERNGTAISYPKIEIKGTNTKDKGKISITLNNKTIGYKGDLESAETLVIDSDMLTAYRIVNGQKVSAINDIESVDFPITRPGQNDVTIAMEGEAVITEVKIYSRTRWI
ncbi:putative phage tail component [Thermoanaerobacter thermohydrosulfuricus WC1]|uniref:Phage tail component n=2 Tax=Thermoanaerobacter TaxID=1754 RepID=D3T334_THEIA|nr:MULTISPECIES: distal tail protein Dit [Thermoanaerobacter]ADD02636.1 phage tail component [Thermoanaerobacter italicus Ab9]EMT38878.1 putative phage tail component [Thermoanaerobacter thermohydrosulfuricus WC1]